MGALPAVRREVIHIEEKKTKRGREYWALKLSCGHAAERDRLTKNAVERALRRGTRIPLGPPKKVICYPCTVAPIFKREGDEHERKTLPEPKPKKCPGCSHLLKRHDENGCQARYSAGPSGVFRCPCKRAAP